MKIPTITQFNAWTDLQKELWLNHETKGKYKEMMRSRGYFPIIVYPEDNVGIVYEVDVDGKITHATAMTAKEATDRINTYMCASQGLKATN